MQVQGVLNDVPIEMAELISLGQKLTEQLQTFQTLINQKCSS